MARELIYQYNGKANLRDDPELKEDSVPIPEPGTLVFRHSANFRVTSVSLISARNTLPRYIIDLKPIEDLSVH